MYKVIIYLIWLFCCQSAYAYDDADLARDMRQCGSIVHVDTLRALIKTESKNNPYAIADAGPVTLPWRIRKGMVRSFYPTSRGEAIQIARQLMADGHTVSLGLTQLNDRNFSAFGISLEDAFEPCTNIKHGTQLFAHYYFEALQKFTDVPQALSAALSKYNSGDFYRGKNEGYVDLIYKHAGLTKVNTKTENNKISATAIKVRMFTLGSVNYE